MGLSGLLDLGTKDAIEETRLGLVVQTSGCQLEASNAANDGRSSFDDGGVKLLEHFSCILERLNLNEGKLAVESQCVSSLLLFKRAWNVQLSSTQLSIHQAPFANYF